MKWASTCVCTTSRILLSDLQPLGGLFSALRSSPVRQCMLDGLHMIIYACVYTCVCVGSCLMVWQYIELRAHSSQHSWPIFACGAPFVGRRRRPSRDVAQCSSWRLCLCVSTPTSTCDHARQWERFSNGSHSLNYRKPLYAVRSRRLDSGQRAITPPVVFRADKPSRKLTRSLCVHAHGGGINADQELLTHHT
jgi:hypothetical protein